MLKLRNTLFLLLGAGLACNFLYSPGIVLTDVWLEWIATVDKPGIVEGYRTIHMDYPPFIYLIFFLVAKTSHLLGIELFLGLKLSLLVSLFLTSFVFWLWTRNLWLTALLQLVLLPGSVALVYVDIYFAPTLILSLWALQSRKLLLFTLLFSVTCLIKWQPLIIAPFLVPYLLNTKELVYWKELRLKAVTQFGFKVLLRYLVLLLVAIIALLLGVFGFEPLRAFHLALSDPYLSEYALNFNWVLTHLLHRVYPQAFGPLLDGRATPIAADLRILFIPKLLFFGVYTFVFIAYLGRKRTLHNTLLYSVLGYLAYFTFSTGTHENHLFLVPILAALLASRDKKYLTLFLTCAFISNLNLLKLNLYTTYDLDRNVPFFTRSFGPNLDLFFAVASVLFFITLFTRVVFNFYRRGSQTQQRTQRECRAS